MMRSVPGRVEPGKPSASVSVLDVRLDGTEASVRAALLTLSEALAALKAIPDDLGTLEIVLAEALNNIVEHAYPPDGPQGSIRLLCKAMPEAFVITLIDTGLPMPGATPPAGGVHDLDVAPDDLPEGGFGWHLIHALSQQVDYTRSGDENLLGLRIARHPRTERA